MRTPSRDNDEKLPAREPTGKKPISRGYWSASEHVLARSCISSVGVDDSSAYPPGCHKFGLSSVSAQSTEPGHMESDWLKNRVADDVPNFHALKSLQKIPCQRCGSTRRRRGADDVLGSRSIPQRPGSEYVVCASSIHISGTQFFATTFKTWKLGAPSATRFFSQLLSICPGSGDCATTSRVRVARAV